MANKGNILAVLPVLFLITTLGIGLFLITRNAGYFNLSSKAASSGVNLSASPAAISVTSGQETTAGVLIDTQTNPISAVELILTYDPANVTITSLAAANFFPSPLTLSPANIASGKASIILGNQPSINTKGVSGSGILATFKFKASATSVINLSTSKIAVIGQTTNTLGTVTNLQLTVTTPTTVGTKPPVGWMDTTNCTNITGWTGDPDNPNGTNTARVYADGTETTGKFLGTVTANIPREPTVCQIIGGQNCGVCPTDQPQCKHAFSLATPSTLKDGKTHQIYAYGVNLAGTGGQDILLLGSPKTITCTPTGTQPPVGWMDTTNCTTITGWTGDPDSPNSQNTARIYADGLESTGKYLGTVTANIPREPTVCQIIGGQNCSVCPANQPQCQHAFSLATPASLKDGKTHQIYTYGVNLAGTGGQDILLLGSPKTITCQP